MRKKYKMTGFARFLIFMVFFAPIAYLGASYYQGQDGIANIKKFLGLEEVPKEKQVDLPTLSKDDIIKMKDQEIQMLKERIAELEAQAAKTE